MFLARIHKWLMNFSLSISHPQTRYTETPFRCHTKWVRHILCVRVFVQKCRLNIIWVLSFLTQIKEIAGKKENHPVQAFHHNNRLRMPQKHIVQSTKQMPLFLYSSINVDLTFFCHVLQLRFKSSYKLWFRFLFCALNDACECDCHKNQNLTLFIPPHQLLQWFNLFTSFARIFRFRQYYF